MAIARAGPGKTPVRTFVDSNTNAAGTNGITTAGRDLGSINSTFGNIGVAATR